MKVGGSSNCVRNVIGLSKPCEGSFVHREPQIISLFYNKVKCDIFGKMENRDNGSTGKKNPLRVIVK